jgi:hypothetical protein
VSQQTHWFLVKPYSFLSDLTNNKESPVNPGFVELSFKIMTLAMESTQLTDKPNSVTMTCKFAA